jgi:hypothetical protein
MENRNKKECSFCYFFHILNRITYVSVCVCERESVCVKCVCVLTKIDKVKVIEIEID